MRDIRFFTVENVIQMHDRTMREHGGLGGVRDLGLLESAVMMPQARFGGEYLHDGVPAMAAAYLYHIAQNHAFHDGDKRPAVLAALTFLDHNGFEITAKNKDIVGVGLAVASGQMNKPQLTKWMGRFVKPRPANS